MTYKSPRQDREQVLPLVTHLSGRDASGGQRTLLDTMECPFGFLKSGIPGRQLAAPLTTFSSTRKLVRPRVWSGKPPTSACPSEEQCATSAAPSLAVYSQHNVIHHESSKNINSVEDFVNNHNVKEHTENDAERHERRTLGVGAEALASGRRDTTSVIYSDAMSSPHCLSTSAGAPQSWEAKRHTLVRLAPPPSVKIDEKPAQQLRVTVPNIVLLDSVLLDDTKKPWSASDEPSGECPRTANALIDTEDEGACSEGKQVYKDTTDRNNDKDTTERSDGKEIAQRSDDNDTKERHDDETREQLRFYPNTNTNPNINPNTHPNPNLNLNPNPNPNLILTQRGEDSRNGRKAKSNVTGAACGPRRHRYSQPKYPALRSTAPCRPTLRQKLGLPELQATFRNRCPNRHPLIHFRPKQPDWYCSSCDHDISVGSDSYGCRKCNYDLCAACFSDK